jgi:hypothetical protein
MLTVVEVGKYVGKSADCNIRIWMGSTSVKRIMFIIPIFYFFFSLMFAILLFLTGTEYVSLFVPARNVYNRTRLSVFVALTVLSHIVCSFTQLTRGPSTSQNLLSCSTLTHSLTRAHAHTHAHTHRAVPRVYYYYYYYYHHHHHNHNHHYHHINYDFFAVYLQLYTRKNHVC